MTGCHNIYVAIQLCYVVLYARRSTVPSASARTSQRTYSLCSITAVKHAKISSRPRRLLTGNHSMAHSITHAKALCLSFSLCVYTQTHTPTHTHHTHTHTHNTHTPHTTHTHTHPHTPHTPHTHTHTHTHIHVGIYTFAKNL